ncbi:transcription elongation factor GreA [Candidatus Nomurabacteria bacterium CG_4_10_14_0_2_um_filter_33_9]|uniref:Transcription elongation factor GreA n=1 Tax=Candidatus Nomurabacteria bacterium CG_4_10_14_0_2_um_filter_33_9 TaxID=1974728 RepID=A0A2J0MD93_9BACT|nr:MAG: transcription elongation factor GreA [Candidatus Nomurabacteria bacterium CG_4_10_14_0_2_um_filter_33_9]
MIKQFDSKKYITKEGLEKLKGKLEELITKRQEIANRIEEVKEMGDLSENAEYTEAKEEQGFTEGIILKLEDLINNAVIIDNQDKKMRAVVEVGSHVKVKVNDKEKEYSIVGASETDPLNGNISNESPLGQALIGKKVGEVVDADAPRGKIRYTILEIK